MLKMYTFVTLSLSINLRKIDRIIENTTRVIFISPTIVDPLLE